MRWKRLWTIVALTTLLATACTSALGSAQLPGLQALGEGIGLTDKLVSGPLRQLADQAEAAAPLLDVVQIEYDDEGDVVVFAILNMPAQGEQSDQEYAAARFDAIRAAVEALWGAALEHTPEASNVGVAFMQVRAVTTLDRGPAPVAWMLAGVVISLEDAAGYLEGPRSLETFRSFWASDAVNVIPLDDPYGGTPNHPVRSLTA